MPTKPTAWEARLAGAASGAFARSLARSAQESAQAGRGSEMVRQSAPGLDQGPKPPAGLYHAIKSQDFDRRWREEQRSAKAQRAEGKRVYADFVRNARRGMRR